MSYLGLTYSFSADASTQSTVQVTMDFGHPVIGVILIVVVAAAIAAVELVQRRRAAREE